MKARNCIKWEVIKLEPGECAICGKKADYILLANGFFRRSQKDLCKKHQLAWNNNELDI